MQELACPTKSLGSEATGSELPAMLPSGRPTSQLVTADLRNEIEALASQPLLSSVGPAWKTAGSSQNRRKKQLL